MQVGGRGTRPAVASEVCRQPGGGASWVRLELTRLGVDTTGKCGVVQAKRGICELFVNHWIWVY